MIIAKLTGLVAGLLHITLLKMKLAVLSLPSSDFVTITLPSMWTDVRVYLSPPYLFFTVHCIVFVIWFLSKQTNKLHHHHHASDKKQRPEEEEGGGPSVEIGTAKTNLQDDWTRAFSQLQFFMPLSGTGSESSFVTTTIEGDLVVDSRRKRRASTRHRNPAPLSGKEEKEEEEDKTIDATWKYIMAMNKPSRQLKKSETTWRVSSEMETVQSPSVIMKKLTTFSNDPRRGPPVLITDEEMDAFIKKVKDQFRLQREDSYNRGVGGRN